MVHPRAPDDWEAELNRMLDAHSAAVGEIGLDCWKEGLNYEGQEDVFVTQPASLLSAIFPPASIA